MGNSHSVVSGTAQCARTPALSTRRVPSCPRVGRSPWPSTVPQPVLHRFQRSVLVAVDYVRARTRAETATGRADPLRRRGRARRSRLMRAEQIGSSRCRGSGASRGKSSNCKSRCERETKPTDEEADENTHAASVTTTSNRGRSSTGLLLALLVAPEAAAWRVVVRKVGLTGEGGALLAST